MFRIEQMLQVAQTFQRLFMHLVVALLSERVAGVLVLHAQFAAWFDDAPLGETYDYNIGSFERDNGF